jgi:hypothetical protein
VLDPLLKWLHSGLNDADRSAAAGFALACCGFVRTVIAAGPITPAGAVGAGGAGGVGGVGGAGGGEGTSSSSPDVDEIGDGDSMASSSSSSSSSSASSATPEPVLPLPIFLRFFRALRTVGSRLGGVVQEEIDRSYEEACAAFPSTASPPNSARHEKWSVWGVVRFVLVAGRLFSPS